METVLKRSNDKLSGETLGAGALWHARNISRRSSSDHLCVAMKIKLHTEGGKKKKNSARKSRIFELSARQLTTTLFFARQL